MLNALSPKLSCSCQEDAADDASGRAAADLDGCFPAPPGSAVGASDSRDVHPATASGFPVRPGDTRDQSLVSCGDNRCASDVDTPVGRTPFAGDDKQKAETHLGNTDNGGTGSSRLLRFHGE